MTFYLKYRPQTIDELDLTQVRDKLSRAAASGEFAHAYLFSGPRGSGKTSAARIVAKRAGAVGIDIIEIDAASTRGIDDIRQMRERIGLVPAEGPKKAYIIDEVHMLTTEAFNALLKTLEEPPLHVMFFLCTTEIDKIPKTIISRCARVDFSPAGDSEINRSIKRAAKGEEIEVDDNAIELIAQAADGSFRDAHTLLEEAVGISKHRKGKKVTVIKADVAAVVGASLFGSADKYAQAVVAGDAAGALAAVNSGVASGVDLVTFSRLALRALRDRLIASPTARLITVAKLVEDRVRTVKYSLLPQLALEIAALELCIGDQKVDPSSPGRAETRLAQPDPAPRDDDKPTLSVTINDVRAKWLNVIQGVRGKNHGVVALLSHCYPKEIDGHTLVIEAKYKFHREQLQHHKFHRQVELTCQEVLGEPIGVRFELGVQTQRILKKSRDDDNIQAATEPDESLVEVAKEIFSS